jgi:hypothetical protein
MIAPAIQNVACTSGEDETITTLAIYELQVDSLDFTSASKDGTEASQLF